MRSVAVLIALGLSGAITLADLASNFEPPDFTGSATGTPLAPQGGWYIPAVAGSVGHDVFTYTDNAPAFPSNPDGGLQFDSGASQGDVNLARAQHTHDFTASPTWCITYDFACKSTAGDPSLQTHNIGSFSLPTGITSPPTNRGFILLNTWNNIDATLGTAWSAGYLTCDAAGTQVAQPGLFAGPEWQNLEFNAWYRQRTEIDFAVNRVVRVSITNLTTGATATVEPADWFLGGGANPGALPMPTDIRFFTGGATAGNITAWDNLTITPTCGGAPCVGDLDGDNSVGLSDLSLLLANFGLSLGDPGYNPAADLNGDNSVGLSDLAILLGNFGMTC